MQFIKTLLWVILIVGAVLFAVNNWVPVSLKLWGGMLLDTKLPMLVIVSFLAGFLPLYLIYRASNWRLKRKIITLESTSGFGLTQRSSHEAKTTQTGASFGAREGGTI